MYGEFLILNGNIKANRVQNNFQTDVMMLWRTPLTRTVHEICDVACHIFPRAKYYPRYHNEGHVSVSRKIWPRLSEGRVTLSTKQISIQWITVNALPLHIRWVPIYPLDGFIHSLYNYDWTPVFFFLKKSLRFDRSKKDYSISKTGDECLSENNYQPAVVRGRHCQKQVVPGKLMSCLH